MDKFISCDWGTSTLRLRLVDSTAATILAETTSEEGIAMVFERWKEIERSIVRFFQIKSLNLVDRPAGTWREYP